MPELEEATRLRLLGNLFEMAAKEGKTVIYFASVEDLIDYAAVIRFIVDQLPPLEG